MGGSQSTQKPLSDGSAWALTIAVLFYVCVGLCLGVFIANKVGKRIPRRTSLYRQPGESKFKGEFVRPPRGSSMGGGYSEQRMMRNPSNLDLYSQSNGTNIRRQMSPRRIVNGSMRSSRSNSPVRSNIY